MPERGNWDDHGLADTCGWQEAADAVAAVGGAGRLTTKLALREPSAVAENSTVDPGNLTQRADSESGQLLDLRAQPSACPRCELPHAVADISAQPATAGRCRLPGLPDDP